MFEFNTPEMGSSGPSAPDLPTQILSRAVTDLTAANKVFQIINDSRPRRRDHLRITPPGEWRERLQDQLRQPAGQAALAAANAGRLYVTPERPLMVVPPLSGPITAKELETAISKSSRRGMWSWPGRLAFLRNFPINDLTGYNEADAENNTLSLLETGYDTRRQGPVDWQLKGPNGLNEARRFNPRIDVAPILATATLGQRYGGQPNSWQDTYTRAIGMDAMRFGDFDCVVDASVYGDGDSYLGDSGVQRGLASRRQVRLEPTA